MKDFGYLPETQAYSGNAGDLNEAITNFQKFAHLPATGIIDDATVRMMHKPRCGVKDVMPGKEALIFDMHFSWDSLDTIQLVKAIKFSIP